MYGMSSNLICRVIGNYRVSSDDADYRRYLHIQELFDEVPGVVDSGVSGVIPGSGEMSRRAFQEGDQVERDIAREKSKTKKLKGEGGVSSGASRMFREMLEDYMPGGYFTWEKFARNLSDNFYRMAYAQFSDLLPKIISDKLKGFNVDRSETSIETDPETINKVIMDSLIYLHDHPEILKDGLVRAYRRREGEQDRGVGIADAFFVPRVDESALAERLKGEGGEGVKVGDADEDVLNQLSGMKDEGKDIKWKWRGIDEYGILRFTLPELYGSREFTVKLPPEIQTIKPGTYTFKIKDVVDGRGAILEFKDQHESISGNALSSIEEDGLGEDQLRKFINNGVVNKYVTFLRSQPAEKLVEDFLGTFTVGPDQISSADDLAELIKNEGGSDESSKGRGKEKVKEKFRGSVERQREKLRAMMERWERAPEVAKYFMKATEADGAQIARVVASQFPSQSEKGVPSLASIFSTAPVVNMVLRFIMSPHMPLGGGGKSMPWVHFAWESFKKMALKDPSVRESVEGMIRHKRDKDINSKLPVSDEEITSLLGGVTQNMVSARMGELRARIAEAVTAAKESPELKKFFERRDVFRSYIKPQLEAAVEQYLKENELSLENPQDVAKVEKFKDKYIQKAVTKMSRSAGQDTLIHQLMIRMSAV
jgi:hypothetical protein